MRRLALAAAIAALAAPAAAQAALTLEPNAPALGFPASVTDAVNGVALTSCQDTSGFCLETPAPNQAAPLSVPDNYTPDGEAFYMNATATVPNAGLGLALFAVEQAFATPGITAGQQILFARIRFRFTTLKPGVKYRITHPYGVDEFVADATGRINQTDDVGCLAPPCDFAAANLGRITSFLVWDPTVAPAAPAGYTGNVNVAHKVIGSPSGTNFVRLEELNPDGTVASVVGETSSFLVQGKLAGAAPAPAPFVIPDTSALKFADRQVGTTAPTANVTIANHGTADLNVSGATVGGTDAGDFTVATNTCTAPVAPGSSCTVGVAFAPQATGARQAALTVASDALNGPHVITLAGTGMPATLPAPDPVVIQAPAPAPVVIHAPAPAPAVAPSLKVSGLRVARSASLRVIRRKGVTVRFRAPAGAGVARLRLVSPAGQVLANKLVALPHGGAQVIHLRAKKARRGRYYVEIATGSSATSLGPRSRSAIALR
jgi:hypothetical protein